MRASLTEVRKNVTTSIIENFKHVGVQHDFGSIARVFGAAFFICLAFELFLKSGIIFSDAFFLDDSSYFARSQRGEIFHAPNLELYRALVGIFGDISSLRIVHLLVFSAGAGLMSVLIMPLVRDPNLSVLIGAFSFLTPFSHILTIFANGTYYAWFALFFLSSALALQCVRFSGDGLNRSWLCLIIGTLLAYLAVSTVDTGVLMLWPLLIFLGVNSRAWTSKAGIFVTSALTAGLIGLTWHTLNSVQHPYKRMPGRLVYSPDEMITNSLYFVSNMAGRYVDPMLLTGLPLRLNGLLPLFVLIACVTIIAGYALVTNRERFFKRVLNPELVPLQAFFILSLIVAVGPYSALSITHIWHYFLPLIFFVPVVAIFLCLVVRRQAAYAFISVAALSTTHATSSAMHQYRQEVDIQRSLACFIGAHASDIISAETIIVSTDGHTPASGITAEFRLTAFFRLVLDAPSLPQVKVYRQPSQAGEFEEAINTNEDAFVLTGTNNFGVITARRKGNSFSAPSRCEPGLRASST